MSLYKAGIILALACIGGLIVVGCASGSSKSGSSGTTCPFARRVARPVAEPVARGGLLYDKFWAVTGTKAPKEDHPLWASRPDKESNARSGAATWRCKECHGWDYVGVYGAYEMGSHRTGFPGIAAVKRSEDEIVALLKADPATRPGGHDYGSVEGLTDADLHALAAFVKEGVMNSTYLIDEDGQFTGDAERGRKIYDGGHKAASACRKCHGTDGLNPPREDNPTFDEFIGRVANENPHELLHKLRFGQPGTKMPALAVQGIDAQKMADLGAYAQTLPHGP